MPNDKSPSESETVAQQETGGDCVSHLVVPLLAWPDRSGFWWLRHKCGMELSESFLHGDPEEDESQYAVRTHNGGEKLFEPSLPRDFEGCAPEFAWLGKSFDILRNGKIHPDISEPPTPAPRCTEPKWDGK